MRLFKRRNSDPNLQFESISSLSEYGDNVARPNYNTNEENIEDVQKSSKIKFLFPYSSRIVVNIGIHIPLLGFVYLLRDKLLTIMFDTTVVHSSEIIVLLVYLSHCFVRSSILGYLLPKYP